MSKTCGMCGAVLEKYMGKYCKKCSEEYLKSPNPFASRAKRKEPKIKYKIFEQVDMKMCRKGCIYYCSETKTCDYMLITGQMRGCDAENCIKYKKGKKKTREKEK